MIRIYPGEKKWLCNLCAFLRYIFRNQYVAGTAAHSASFRVGLISPQADLYGAIRSVLDSFLDLRRDSPLTRTAL